MFKSKSFAAINVNHNDLTMACASWARDGSCSLHGISRSKAAGFRKGMVSDMGSAATSLAEGLKKLKKETGRPFHEVYAGVSSVSAEVIESRGIVLLSKYGRTIGAKDVERCVEIGSSLKVPLDKEPVHRMVRGFALDGEGGIKDPLGLDGVKLEAEVQVLMMNSSVLKNMSKCIAQAGYVPVSHVFCGLASSYRVLSREEKEEGVLLLDVGRDLTESAIFFRGSMSGCKVSEMMLSDLVFPDGSLDAGNIEKMARDVISIPGWQNVRKVVMAGEGALAEDLLGYLETVFGLEVGPATCVARPGESLPVEKVRYACVLGVLDHVSFEKDRRYPSGPVFRRAWNGMMRFMDRYF